MKNCSLCGAGVTAAPNYNKATDCGTTPTQLRTVTIPANKGGDGPTDPYAPVLGAWQNTIVYYAKNKAVYLYDVNGVYTNLTGTDWGTQIAALASQLQTLQETQAGDLEALNQSITSLQQSVQSNNTAITATNTALTTESNTRAATDTSLSQQIISLQTQLNQLGDLEGDVSNFSQALTAETANRTEADTNLQNQVTANTTAIESLEAGSGVNIVQTLGDSTTAVMSQKAVTDSLPTPLTVLQTTGTSTTDPMSQKAVTDALANVEGGGGKIYSFYSDTTSFTPMAILPVGSSPTAQIKIDVSELTPNQEYMVIAEAGIIINDHTAEITLAMNLNGIAGAHNTYVLPATSITGTTEELTIMSVLTATADKPFTMSATADKSSTAPNTLNYIRATFIPTEDAVAKPPLSS